MVGGRRQKSGGAQKAEWIIGMKLQSFSDRIAGYHPALFLKLCNCSFSFARAQSFKILQLLNAVLRDSIKIEHTFGEGTTE